MPFAIATVFHPPLLCAAPPYAHRLVRALRVAGLSAGGTADPHSWFIELFGSAPAAAAFRLLLSGMAQVWPDPLTVFRPCCPHLTHDESSFLTMVTNAGRNDRHSFDQHLREMIDEDARDWLFVSTARFAALL